MDVGHAHMMGDLVDAIETCSGHLITTHLHDNRGSSDDHLVPGEGAIDWDAALMALQKVGYDGAWMFELADTSTAQAGAREGREGARALRRAAAHQRRNARYDRELEDRRAPWRARDMMQHIDKIGEHVGQTVTIKGWLHNRRSSGKIHFLVVRDGTGFLQVVMGKNDVAEETFKAADHLCQESAIIVTGTVARTSARRAATS